MRRHDQQSAGFTLVEMLIVLSLVGILAGMVIPRANTNFPEQLDGIASILAGDVAYARGLAVANSSNYRLTFDVAANQYVLTHTGTNTALNNLPPSPFRRRSDLATQQTVRLADLPSIGPGVRLYAVYAVNNPVPTVTTLEFGPLGETTRTEDTVVWLAAGVGAATRYLCVRVNSVTGLTWIENFRASVPPVPTGSGS